MKGGAGAVAVAYACLFPVAPRCGIPRVDIPLGGIYLGGVPLGL